MSVDILITGVGGQGTVLASKLLAAAAIRAGLPVHTAETIGMAQRGGSVVSHVRIGESFSPLIPTGSADMIIGFEPGETVRCLAYLRPEGAVVTAKAGVMPVTASLGGSPYDPDAMLGYLAQNIENLTIVDGEEICREAGSAKSLNMALLGAAVAKGIPGIDEKLMLEVMEATVAKKFAKANKTAFTLGIAAAR